jgi:phosphate transport system permease protein
MIYKLATSAHEDWHRQAWAAGLVLLGLVLLTNVAARWILSRGIAVQKG